LEKGEGVSKERGKKRVKRERQVRERPVAHTLGISLEHLSSNLWPGSPEAATPPHVGEEPVAEQCGDFCNLEEPLP
jgi:hypothetical protein